MTTSSFFLALLLLSLAFSDLFVQIRGFNFGINYGQVGDNLPSPSDVVVLIKSLKVSKIKLYDSNPDILSAFANSGVEFIVGTKNEDLPSLRDPSNAQRWIQQHVQPYISQTKITCIAVGNEVFDYNNPQLTTSLLPAMQSMYNALVSLGLAQKVTVTSAHSYNVIASSFPPSSGAFKQDLIQYIQPILNFHAQIKSPFLINAYPFFAYKGNPNQISLNYVLFQPNSGSIDPVTNLHYDNMLFAQIDAVYAAIKRLGHTDIEVKISETGWPSKGGPDEFGATPQNAEIYNSNLLKKIEQKQGTPARPSVPVDVFVFALFNENLKPGPLSERNFGLYYPDGNPVYNIGLEGYLPEMTGEFESKSNVLSINFVCIFAFLLFTWELSRH
ncbi:hypothetical protein LR48_Vigan05g167600 [Vigna angularis]|uniref:glucan endo-1,3-beta-D-glucosidase n=2 Tax=Phaseolus angularis TaxID=3914 RepID=A0A0L9UMZ9_PHAAN|nr:glucan endo-1,3-beta-glucosidase 14 [Vigna angularis]KAG2371518.1 Glucan endo-1,3-beta-glucosidase [Vigna angularis]KOM44071.1 hypothetical protein LR48_Vigan05g167600 [Vigna angularis]BAT92082.1 hypothetical protein VIGAN_07074300 [Vigna angularis var. angularis]